MTYIENKIVLNICFFVALIKIANGASISGKHNYEYDGSSSLQRSGKSSIDEQELLEFSKGRLKLTARITVGEPQKGNFKLIEYSDRYTYK